MSQEKIYFTINDPEDLIEENVEVRKSKKKYLLFVCFIFWFSISDQKLLHSLKNRHRIFG